MSHLVRWCQRHRWLVVATWLAAMVLGLTVSQNAGSRYTQDLGNAGAESQQALDLVAKILPGGLPDNELVVIHARQGTIQDPANRLRIAEMIKRISATPGVSGAFDPFSPAGAIPIGGSPVSADGRTAVITVLMKGSATAPDLTAVRAVVDTARDYDNSDLQVDVIGPGTMANVLATISPGPVVIALIGALLVLALTVRSPAAVAICGAIGIVSVGVSMAAASGLSHVASMMSLAPLLALVLSFGLSLSSAVVIVNRAQNGMRLGLAPADAVRTSMRRPGRAALGGSLALALVMLGTSALNLNTFAGIALAGFASAAVSVLVIATLLPAAMCIAGRGMLVWVERRQLLTTGAGLPVRPGLQSWWAGVLSRHPRVYAGASVFVLILLAIPMLSLRLGGSDGGVDTTSTTTRRAFDMISSEYFPGMSSPIVVVATGVSGAPPDAVNHLISGLKATPGVERAFLSLNSDKENAALIQVLATKEPRTVEYSELIKRLRTVTAPTAIEGTGLKVYIGGQTAIFDDASARFTKVLPIFVLLELAVLGLAVGVGLRSLRHSIAVMGASVLALAATLGIISLVFVQGHGSGLLGVKAGPIEPFVLGLIMILVFGLAVGMHLTMLSRLRGTLGEPHQARAISTRHADIGHVVGAANLIMVVVFAALTAQDARIMKLLGAGVSIGVLLDAWVRVVLLPALVHMVRLDPRSAPATAWPDIAGVPETAGRRGRHAQNPPATAAPPTMPGRGLPRLTAPTARLNIGRPSVSRTTRGRGRGRGRDEASSPNGSSVPGGHTQNGGNSANGARLPAGVHPASGPRSAADPAAAAGSSPAGELPHRDGPRRRRTGSAGRRRASSPRSRPDGSTEPAMADGAPGSARSARTSAIAGPTDRTSRNSRFGDSA